MDIQTLVKTVIRTFEDAANLVRRIQQKRDESNTPNPPEGPTNDLLNSLALGPVIIRGHYDHDLKRFGEGYACGDIQAREQMKDVLINLQIALLTGLNQASMDDGEINYTELQTVSDDCRVNAGVCLGQLSQRLSEAARAQSICSQQNGTYTSGSIWNATSPLQYSSSRSTDSSIFSRAQTMSPNTIVDDFSSMKLQQPLTMQSPINGRPISTSSSSSHELNQAWGSAWLRTAPIAESVREWGSGIATTDVQSMRRPSSHCLSAEDTQRLSPIANDKSPQSSPRPRSVEVDQSGQNESSRVSGTSSTLQKMTDEPPFSPDHISHRAPTRMSADDYPSYTTHWDAQQPQSISSQQSYRASTNSGSGSDYSTLEHVQYLQTASRAPVSDTGHVRAESSIYSNESQYDFPIPPQGVKRLPNTTDQLLEQIPMEYSTRPSVSAPIPIESKMQAEDQARQAQEQKPNGYSVPSNNNNSASVSNSNTITSTLGPLTLPTEKNTLGFCRGAFRLLIGLERKAFTIHNRPLGLSSVLPYWKCEKCTFEGPCVIVNNPVPGAKKGKTKAEKTFDTNIRKYRSGGSGGGGGASSAGGNAGAGVKPGPVSILYKWAFLAKCHVSIKSMPEGEGSTHGEYGSFGCVFCACEATRRGWALGGNDIITGGSAEMDKKGRKGGGGSKDGGMNGTGGGSTPIFGNVASFMEHLQVHRREDMWPGVEMCGRVKAVVGRLPEKGEDFDVALLPL